MELRSARVRMAAPALALVASLIGGAAHFSVAMAQQAPRAQPQRPAQTPAPAQPEAPTAVALKASPEQPEWVKVCGEDPTQKKTVCYTTRDFVSDNNQPVLAVAVYEVKNDPKRFVRLLMPLGFLLQPGLRLGVDKAQPLTGRFQICFPNGCFAEVDMQEAQVVNLKKAAQIRIDVQNQAAREVNFVIPMDGFGKAYDGAPIDPKVLQEQAKKLQEEMERRAKEFRERQGQAPQPAPGVAAPAPRAN